MLLQKNKKLLKSSLASDIAKEYGLHQLPEALEHFKTHSSAGKIIMKASLIPEGFEPQG